MIRHIRNGFLILIVSLSTCAQVPLNMGNQKQILEMQDAERSVVLLKNELGKVPLRDLQTKKIASINVETVNASIFDSLLSKYAAVKSFSVANKRDSLDKLSSGLKFYNTLIVQISEGSVRDSSVLTFIRESEKNKEVIVVASGRPFILASLNKITSPVIWSPKESAASAGFAAQLIFGGVVSTAKLVQTVSPAFKQGDGYITATTRLKYTMPEELGINSAELEKPIDDIVYNAIAQRATPGAVVLVAKDGKVIFNKAYGNRTLQGDGQDKVTDIFDLASVTKIAATTIAAMRLYEQGKLRLDTNVGAYIPEARETNKNFIKVKDVLLHQAGLVPYIPFYENIRPGDFSSDSSEEYNVKVAENYYLRKGYYEEVMWPKMLRSHLENPGRYEYSDLSMYTMKEIIERISVQRLDIYVLEQFYRPLGMFTAGYNPRNRFAREAIVPTEQDNYFRRQLLQGYVHDQGAALAGGVSGHAGVFATANDLAILFQMMLNGGTYGGMRYFKPETIDLFTSRQSNISRRGYGFDRWDPETSKKYPAALASPQTYGHTGFTGTCVWVDPKYNLIYVFLSNRVNTGGSNRLQSLQVRSRIQDAVYKAIQKAEE